MTIKKNLDETICLNLTLLLVYLKYLSHKQVKTLWISLSMEFFFTSIFEENICFLIVWQGRSSFHLEFLESAYTKTQNPDLSRQKDFGFSLGIVN